MKLCERLEPSELFRRRYGWRPTLRVAPLAPLKNSAAARVRAATYANSPTLNPASSAVGGAGMGTGAIRKGSHYRDSK
jgi:hypothetical protein